MAPSSFSFSAFCSALMIFLNFCTSLFVALFAALDAICNSIRRRASSVSRASATLGRQTKAPLLGSCLTRFSFASTSNTRRIRARLTLKTSTNTSSSIFRTLSVITTCRPNLPLGLQRIPRELKRRLGMLQVVDKRYLFYLQF